MCRWPPAQEDRPWHGQPVHQGWRKGIPRLQCSLQLRRRLLPPSLWGPTEGGLPEVTQANGINNMVSNAFFRNPYQEWCYNFPKTYGTSFLIHRLMFIASIFGCTAVLLLSRSIFGSSWAGIPPSRGILFLFGYVFGESYPFNTKFVQNYHENNLQHSSWVPWFCLVLG